MNWIILICLLLASPLLAQTTPESLYLWESPPTGLNQKFLSHNLLNTQFKDMSNVFSDEEVAITMRGGFTNFNTVAITSASVRFIKEYSTTAGNRYMVAVSSHHLCYTSSGTFITLITTINPTSVIWGTQYNNLFYIGENKGDSWEFDGAVLRSTGIPQCKYAITEFDRIFVANIAGYSSQIKYSRIGTPANFEGDAWINFNKDDGEEISGITSYNGNIYVFKPHAIGVLIGVNDDYPDNDGVITLNTEIGCSYNSTIQIKDNMLVFQSARGIEGFDGTNVVLLSELISPIMDTLTNRVAGKSSWLEATTADFTSNTEYLGFNFNSDRINPEPRKTLDSSGSVGEYSSMKVDSFGNPHIVYYDDTNDVIKYSSYTATVGSWSTSSTGLSVSVVGYLDMDLDSKNNPHVVFSVDTTAVEYSSFTPVKGWATVHIFDDSAQYPCIKVDSINNPHIAFYEPFTFRLIYSSCTASVRYWSRSSFTSGADEIGKYPSITVDNSNNAHIAYVNATTKQIIYSSYTVATGWKTLTAYAVFDVSIGRTSIALDSLNNPHIAFNLPSYALRVTSHNYTSDEWTPRSAGTGDSPSIAIDSSNTEFVSYYSSDGDGRYLRLSTRPVTAVDFTSYFLDANHLHGKNSSLDLYNSYPMISYYDYSHDDLEFYTAYMYYISTKRDVTGSDYTFNGWDSFECDNITNSDVLRTNFYIFTGATLAALPVSSTTITPGQKINSTLSPFTMYKIIMEPLIPTDGSISSSYIDNVSISFNINETAFEPVSIIDDRRYWCSFAVEPNQNNTLILVLDKNNNWTQFDGIPARSFCEFNNELYFGSSDDTGLVYKYSSDYTTDTSTKITTMIQTKDFDLGSWLQDKYIAAEGCWVITEPSVLYSTMTVAYYIDKSTTAEISVDLDILPDADYPSRPVIRRMNNYTDRFRYINFKITNFSKFNGLNLFYNKHEIGEE